MEIVKSQWVINGTMIETDMPYKGTVHNTQTYLCPIPPISDTALSAVWPIAVCLGVLCLYCPVNAEI